MVAEFVKDGYNDLSWDIGKFTKSNGGFGRNAKNQLAFIPKKLPLPLFYDNEFVMLLARAERKVGEQRAEYSVAKRGLANRESNPEALEKLREYYG